LAYKRPDFLSQAMNNWLEQYDRVVVDTSPLLNLNRHNIPAQSVARVCDGAILVVLAGQTTSLRIQAGMELLAQADVELLGTVLNCRDKPTLASEICREINRIPLLPTSWKARLKARVYANEYLGNTL
jgi:Mrp family chromosome partitioning ATPase